MPVAGLNEVTEGKVPPSQPVFAGLSGVFNLAASAGNEPDLDFPLFPSGWNTVIGVSAYEGNRGAQVPWMGSSIGDVIFTGAWYEYENTGLYYAGTSFAAPVMSVFTALRLTIGANACPFYEAPPAMATGWYNDLASVPSLELLLTEAAATFNTGREYSAVVLGSVDILAKPNQGTGELHKA